MMRRKNILRFRTLIPPFPFQALYRENWMDDPVKTLNPGLRSFPFAVIFPGEDQTKVTVFYLRP